jgi:hypothetical protein
VAAVVRPADLSPPHAALHLSEVLYGVRVPARRQSDAVGLRDSRTSDWLDTFSHVMPGMQEEAAAKIDAGLREALAG